MNQRFGNRRHPRISGSGLTITINGKTYRIININEDGVGFILDSPDELTVGREIKPMVLNGDIPVRVAGIPRHISQIRGVDHPLAFKTGWVCGTEFTPRHDRDGKRLLQQFIAESIDRGDRQSED